MSREDLDRWEKRYRRRPHHTDNLDPWIVAKAGRLPAGRALDVACGVGQHARWLAAHGHRVLAIDGSDTALRYGRTRAIEEGTAASILFVQADLEHAALPACAFNLIVVARFLLRPLAPRLTAALRPGGHLLYVTYTRRRLRQRPDMNPAYLLAHDELPNLFSSLAIITYDEVDDRARLHARRPNDV